MPNALQWKCKSFNRDLSRRTQIMGVVNVTPDSFSDGGRFYDTGKSIEHAYQLVEAGADIIDVGGESSRPGAEPVSVEEELKRVMPVVREMAGQAHVVVSIDTVKYEVAKQALEAGAVIVNDISGLKQEPRLAELAVRYDAALVLMHMRGTPQTMQSQTDYDDVAGSISQYFENQIDAAQQMGVQLEHIMLDPGIGFSKTAEQNLVIIKRLEAVRVFNRPLLLGVSRKSFIGKLTNKDAANREFGTAAAVTACILNGANAVRVHDVEAMRDVVKVADAIKQQSMKTGEENQPLCG